MSHSIPTGFGAVLRRRREELALSLEDMAASTRIRKTYLQALEEENLDGLPGGTYAVGFLKIYARQLSLPVEPLLAALNDGEERGDGAGSAPPGSSRRQRLPSGKQGKKEGRRLYLLLLLLAAVAAVYGGFRAGAPSELSRPARLSSPEPAARQVAPQPQPVPQQVVPQPQPAVSPPSPVTPPVAGQTEVKSTELAVIPPGGAVVRMLPTVAGTMKVSLDGQETRAYELQPDQSLHWKVSDSLAVEFSSPGLSRIWVDQQELPIAEYPALILKRVNSQEARP